LLYLLLQNKDYGYINFDDINLYGVDSRTLLNSFIELYGNVEYILIDEIQNLPDWELFINNLQVKYNVFITGSNSKLLSGELSSHLAGRHIQIHLFPFSFSEYILNTKNMDDLTDYDINIIKNKLTYYMNTGGFPEVLINNENLNRYLGQLYSDIIEKDIIIRYKISYKKTFIDLSDYIINSYSGYISYNKLKHIFNTGSVHTIKNYVYYLEQSFLIFIINKFSYKEKEIKNSVKKVYLIDNGFISITDTNTKNIGRSIENLVAINLNRLCIENGYSLYYWKDYNNNEVDFIVKSGMNIISLTQATFSNNKYDINKREITALLKASKELKCNNLIIITWDYDDILQIGNKNIKCIPLWKWLINNKPA
jgi:predicted AAA+ superfamily ATPase